jgi:hypothetical protein
MSTDTLQLAKKEYLTGDASVKEVLKRIFGEESFKHNWRDIKTPIDAFDANGVTMEEVLPYPNPKTPKQQWLNAVSTMDEIVRAINPGFFEQIDWTDRSQYKWFSWFKYRKASSGFRFFASGCDNVNTRSAGGSRLCSESDEKNKYIAEQFIDIWNIILLK